MPSGVSAVSQHAADATRPYRSRYGGRLVSAVSGRSGADGISRPNQIDTEQMSGAAARPSAGLMAVTSGRAGADPSEGNGTLDSRIYFNIASIAVERSENSDDSPCIK